MWKGTDQPVAYLITFRCYGTWLHGDRRGSVDRHNTGFYTPKYPKSEHWKEISSGRMRRSPVRLDSRRRASVEKAIRETCKKRGWVLYAINVRSNHVHIVVSTGRRLPSIHLNAFKSNVTRQMREDGVWDEDRSPWSDKGSERWLWNDRQVGEAIDYVLYSQGDDFPSFD